MVLLLLIGDCKTSIVTQVIGGFGDLDVVVDVVDMVVVVVTRVQVL